LDGSSEPGLTLFDENSSPVLLIKTNWFNTLSISAINKIIKNKKK